MSLTYQQVRHFRDSGYLKIDSIIDQMLVQELANFVRTQYARSDQVQDGPVRNAGQVKLYRIYERDPSVMKTLICHPQILSVLGSLLGPNIVFIKNRHNQAAINRPGEVSPRLHRDVLQWTRNVITVVVYLENASVANGCTYLVPGSHYLPSMGVPQVDGGGTWMDEHEVLKEMSEQALPVPVKRGGILIFDSLLFHTVGSNESDSDRLSIVLGYRSVDELEPRPADQTQMLVAGEDIYRGNDRSSRHGRAG